MITGVEIKSGLCDPDFAPSKGDLSFGLEIVYLYAKLDDSSFSKSRDHWGLQ